MDSREAFEAVYIKLYPAASFERLETNPEEYIWEKIENAWIIWQASQTHNSGVVEYDIDVASKSIAESLMTLIHQAHGKPPLHKDPAYVGRIEYMGIDIVSAIKVSLQKTLATLTKGK